MSPYIYEGAFSGKQTFFRYPCLLPKVKPAMIHYIRLFCKALVGFKQQNVKLNLGRLVIYIKLIFLVRYCGKDYLLNLN